MDPMRSRARVEKQVVYRVGREEVWAAITRPEELSRWFGMEVVSLDLRPAGRIVFKDSGRTSRRARRREVIRRLSEHASMTATELAGVLPVTRQAIAKHLAELEQASLVVGERVGRENRYRLTPAPMGEAVSWMNSVGAQWDDRLSRLGNHLGGDQPEEAP